MKMCVGRGDNLTDALKLLQFHFGLDLSQEKLVQELQAGVSDLVDDKALKASRILIAQDDVNSFGVGYANIYLWERLSPQLLIKFDKEEGKIWLSKMGNEVGTRGQYPIAVELAYYCINQEYQSRGIGKAIFFQTILNSLSEINTFNLVFLTIAMGCYAGTGVGQQIRQYLLEDEKNINGVSPDGKIIVTGVKKDLGEVEEIFEVTSANFRTREQSIATRILAEKIYCREIGLSKNLSPVFAREFFQAV